MKVPYRLRRFWWWLKTGEMVCMYRTCPKPRVGISIWCREHTDRILAKDRTENPRDWPVKPGAWW